MLLVCQIFSSYNFHWTADFATREDSAVVSRFKRARSHDVNDSTHLINSDFKYLQQNALLCRLMNLWNLTEPVKSSALA